MGSRGTDSTAESAGAVKLKGKLKGESEAAAEGTPRAKATDNGGRQQHGSLCGATVLGNSTPATAVQTSGLKSTTAADTDGTRSSRSYN